ncbi:putative LRR receptor-like serine/threonine-protein kinase [Camellia lanceoleosa]|uniref:LRR receptor-like serine/threonine-protein kinase n=1 Tax=Camellia lanceoleosa TaxID=1840588 RepID=A0ACC0FAQ6_9ERIC|nr:putative LRR receptor-like serine/threonine-protein kinase [Camellia lanceoleosa]
MVDVICYLCKDENLSSPSSALKSPVSVLLPKLPGLVRHVEPSSRNLQSNGLTGKLPSELGNFKYLEELRLDRNNLQGNVPATNIICLGIDLMRFRFGYGVGFVAALYALLEWEKTLQIIGIVGLAKTLYRRVASYENAEDFKQDMSKALAEADRKDLMRKLPKFIYDEEKALEVRSFSCILATATATAKRFEQRTRKILTEKIAQLNSAIDDVSSQLRADDTPNGARSLGMNLRLPYDKLFERYPEVVYR